ncbi:MAG TPA: DUF4097 family beta strand repeat-containing protein [Saprospiraceae bacterium]|nr:DUF4097 family beta strand repeat-containing protein [Saprospiraceae bacterium]HMP24388.1 DUF4097 family beta strand repeat-containing protein [Saprospiraceae bacterium]
MQYKNLILLSLCCWVSSVEAQTTVQVITKKIEKTFAYRQGYEVNVEGEKAEVIVESWDRDEIKIQLELTARHPDKAVAEKDLAAIKYLADRVKNKIYVRNYLSVAEDAPEPQAVLSARYLIYVPETCPVYLKNYFGTINVSNLLNSVKINSEFSKIGLNNVQGMMDIRTRFGDLVGANLDGDMKLNARRSDITLRDIKGHYDLTAQYGVMKIFAAPGLLSLNINAEKTDVFVYNANPAIFGYNISAQAGNVTLPANLQFEYLQNTEQVKRIQFKPITEYYATITISVSFGDIFVGGK